MKLILAGRKRVDYAFRFLCFFAISMSWFLMGLVFYQIVSDSSVIFYNYTCALPLRVDSSEILNAGPEGYDLLRNVLRDSVNKFADSRCVSHVEDLVNKLFTPNANLEMMDTIKAKKSGVIFSINLTMPVDLHPVISGKIHREDVSCVIEAMKKENLLQSVFNKSLFTKGDSFSPEFAGILTAVSGSVFAMLVAFLVSFPIGVLTGIYLYEIAKDSPIFVFIKSGIANLASIPSIIFGVFGFTFYIALLGLPRGSSLVGGLTLALMMLPHIIGTVNLSLRSVPAYVRDAAFGLGASRMQVLVHHVFPLALPGILHGSLLAVARVIGESSPLLMLGLVAFVVDVPTSVTDKATVLPVQVYLWTNATGQGFSSLASVVLLALLVILVVINIISSLLQKQSDHFSF